METVIQPTLKTNHRTWQLHSAIVRHCMVLHRGCFEGLLRDIPPKHPCDRKALHLLHQGFRMIHPQRIKHVGRNMYGHALNTHCAHQANKSSSTRNIYNLQVGRSTLRHDVKHVLNMNQATLLVACLHFGGGGFVVGLTPPNPPLTSPPQTPRRGAALNAMHGTRGSRQTTLESRTTTCIHVM